MKNMKNVACADQIRQVIDLINNLIIQQWEIRVF